LRKGDKPNTNNDSGKQTSPHSASPFALKMRGIAALDCGLSREGLEPIHCRCTIAPVSDGRRAAEACQYLLRVAKLALVKLPSRLLQ
jgi:hypothetical protein